MDADAGDIRPEKVVPVALDPFGFWPEFVSRIGRLGGDIAGPTSSYAFHSPYVPSEDGPVEFTIRFDGLSATKGSLTLSVNVMPNREGAAVFRAAADVVPFRNILLDEGVARIRVDSYDDARYAVLGNVMDDTDATAESLSIEMSRVADVEAERDRMASSRRTEFEAKAVRPVPRLVSKNPATLTDPVSQMCTVGQFAEPAYDEWATALGEMPQRQRHQWERVFILQALRRYGVLAPGAHGLGFVFGAGNEALPPLIEARGCTVCLMDAAGGGDASPALNAFDFSWSTGICAQLGSLAASVRFVEDMVGFLKPGGVAVHVFDYVAGGAVVGDDDAPVRFARRDFERLSLNLISRGHEVAQFKYDPGDPASGGRHGILADGVREQVGADVFVTSFGIVMRRGLHS